MFITGQLMNRRSAVAEKNSQHTRVKTYISFNILVERLKRGFPLKPPDSSATGFCLTESGLEMVVLDMI